MKTLEAVGKWLVMIGIPASGWVLGAVFGGASHGTGMGATVLLFGLLLSGGMIVLGVWRDVVEKGCGTLMGATGVGFMLWLLFVLLDPLYRCGDDVALLTLIVLGLGCGLATTGRFIEKGDRWLSLSFGVFWCLASWLFWTNVLLGRSRGLWS